MTLEEAKLIIKDLKDKSTSSANKTVKVKLSTEEEAAIKKAISVVTFKIPQQ